MRSSSIEPLEARIAPATLAITPAVDEGDSTVVKQIKVTLDTAPAADVIVHYTILEGSAHFGDQFSLSGASASGTLTFAANTTEAAFDVILNGNITLNSDSNFQVRIDDVTTGSGVTVPASPLMVAIWDDDRTVDFTQTSFDQSVNEGSAASPGHFDYGATLSAPAEHDIVVIFQTQAHGNNYGDATAAGAAADYTAVTKTLTFTKGSVTPTEPPVTVNVIGDSLPGPDEFFNVTLSKPSTTAAFGAKLGQQNTTSISAASLILSDDGNDQSDLTVTLGNDITTSEGGVALFDVKLSRLSESAVVVTYHTADGVVHTATAGADYDSALAGVKSIDGVLNDHIQVQVTSDTHVESAEDFKLVLDGASIPDGVSPNGIPLTLGAKTSATATIAADPLPKLVFVKVDPAAPADPTQPHALIPPAAGSDITHYGDVSVIESSATTVRTADFQVKLAYLDANGKVDLNHHFDLTEAASFDFMTVDGSAVSTAGGDFVFTSGSHTFDPGTTEATETFKISVPIKADDKIEPDQTFTLKLTNAHGAAIGDDTAVGTIIDPTVVLKVADVSVTEGNQGSTTAVFTILPGRAIPAGFDLLVDYTTVDGTAIGTANPTTHSPQDFQGPITPGTLRFAPGTTFQTVGVSVNGDTVIEGNETFQLHLSNARLVPTGTNNTGDSVNLAGPADGGKPDGTGTIIDDDGHAISASITADAASQAEGAAGTKANFTVHLSQSYDAPITVNYNVTKPNAAGTLVTSPASFVIPAYTKDAPLPIDYINDTVAGHDQNITVTLTSLTATAPHATFTPLVTGKTAKTTVLEDDFFVQIVDNSLNEGDSGTDLLKFKVQLVDITGALIDVNSTMAGNQGLDHAVSVNFNTIDGTGTYGATSTGNGADFLARSATLVFAPGEVDKTADITIRGDKNAGVPDTSANPTNPMGNETFSVQLGTPTGGQLRPAHGIAVGTILNDDGVVQPTLTLVPLAPGVEADTAHGIAGSPATFKVSLTDAAGQPMGSEQPITFEYSTSVLTPPHTGDIADQDDFTQIKPGVVDPAHPENNVVATLGTIASGDTTATLSVAVTADGSNENVESFGFNVTHVQGAANSPTATQSVEGTIAASNRPMITVDNVSGLEGEMGTSTLTFTIKLSAASDKDVTFNIQTLAGSGTATANNDYVALATTPVTIPHGQRQVTQTITINGDADAEANETFTFRVSDVVNALPATPGANTVDATGTILNDDSVFTVTAAATVHEGDQFATLVIHRTDSHNAADVSFKTIDGTALSVFGSTAAFPDFIGGTGAVHFADGATDVSINIPLVDNNRHEGDETFSVQLTGTTNGILGAAKTSLITIQDNDVVPTATLVSPATVTEKDSGTTAVTFTVNLDHANEADDIVLKYSTANLSAVAGQDYTGVTDQTLTIPKGSTTGSFTIQVLNDTTLDLLKTESFQVSVFPDPAVTGAARVQFASGVSTLLGTASIIDNDVAPQVSIAAGSFDEGVGNTFTVSLNHASDKAITVKYYTVNGTAVSGVDFTGKTAAAASTITFAAGETSKTITVATTDDQLVEGNETFKVQLVSPVGATLSKTAAVATGTILDNDHAYLSINDVTIQEGDNGTQDAIFTVSLLGDTAAPFTFTYTTADGTALVGSDYIAKSGSLKLGGVNGLHTAQIVVKVVGDLIKESADETFSVNLTNSPVAVATLTKASGIGTIVHDGDSQVTLSVSNQTLAEGDPTSTATGDKTMTFTATLSEMATTDVTFHVKASDILKAANVARLGSDYTAPADVVYTIPAGQLTKSFDITIKADQVFETTEFFNVTLTNIVGAQPGHAVGTGTIYDNDLYFSQRLIKWTDVDGDLVTLSVNKGNLATVGFGFDTTSSPTMGGRILQQLNLVSSQAGTTFNHGNLSIVSTQQPNAAGVLSGDGLVNVGYIRANTYDSAPTVLELTGIDLANVAIDGDLSRINVGDLFSDPALGLLSAYSIGVKSATTEAVATGSTFHGPAQSQILAGATAIKVVNDISGVITVTGGSTGKIGTLTVGGALRGTAEDDSARILTTGAIGRATFHDIIGGAGKHSASLTQVDSTASLGALIVTGNITAGTGVESAHVLFPSIGSVSIGGNFTGGSTGGGFLSASNSLGTVTIGGNFDGGARILGGGLNGAAAINSVLVHGNVNNAQIKGGYIANIVDSFTSVADLEFKANADAQINSVEVDGSVLKLDIVAGTDPASPTSAFAQDSAAIFSRIAKVIFNGDLIANPEAHYVTAQSIGSIIVQGAAKSATIPGAELAPGTKFFAKFAI